MPIASVPTGTPPGICTIESRESSPLNALRPHREPPAPAGRYDAANIPGRCAAPPAPATITWIPRPAAVVAYSVSRSGVRWAETTSASNGTPNSRRTPQAARIVGRSLRDPITTPTRGVWWELSAMPAS